MGAPGFIDCVHGALRDAEALCDTELLASSGNFAVRIRHRDPDLAKDYVRSFLPAQPWPEARW